MCATAVAVTRVVLVDDDPLVRAGLASILGSAADLEIVGQAGDGAAALDAVRRVHPDVVLMDIRMPRVDGIAATRAVTALPNPPKVLVLTTFRLDDYVFGALEAGASGFMLKDAAPRDLIDAVRTVADGKAMLSPEDTLTLINHYAAPQRLRRRDEARRMLSDLSPREQDVAVEVARGLSNAEIAERLFCSEATVKAHLTHIFAKAGCANRVRVALMVHDAGMDFSLDTV